MITQFELDKAKKAFKELKEYIEGEEGVEFDKYLDVNQIYNPLLDFHHNYILFSKDPEFKSWTYQKIKELPNYEKLKRKGMVHYDYLRSEVNSIISSFERILEETQDLINNINK